MTSIGATLRSERLRRGLKLEQVAAETKIRIHLLEAMEDDHFDRLPGGFLTCSFLRQYAHALGLSEDGIIAAFKLQFDQPADPLPEPLPQQHSWHLSHSPELIWVLAAVFACAGTYRLWQGSQRPSPEIVVSAPGSRPTQKLSASAPTQGHPPESKFRSDTVSGSRTMATLALEGQPSTPGPVQDGGEQTMRVAFTATEPVWLSIKSDGAQTYRGTLEGQQSKEFDASSKMTVLVGNAGGLGVSLNGRQIGSIGRHGEVQLLLLTPQGAYVVPRTRDASIE